MTSTGWVALAQALATIALNVSTTSTVTAPPHGDELARWQTGSTSVNVIETLGESTPAGANARNISLEATYGPDGFAVSGLVHDLSCDEQQRQCVALPGDPELFHADPDTLDLTYEAGNNGMSFAGEATIAGPGGGGEVLTFQVSTTPHGPLTQEIRWDDLTKITTTWRTQLVNGTIGGMTLRNDSATHTEQEHVLFENPPEENA